jgi:uncharacterized protein YgiM (DUF1202 family)
MKRFLLAAATALLISTGAASAYEMNCDAPVVPLGDNHDNNPVVSIDISYIPGNHPWRVYHNLRNGVVVERSEQYAMLDATDDHKVQWQGRLYRNRNIFMVGELRRDKGGVVYYMEWQYDRSKGNALMVQSSARCAMAAPPQPETSMLFMIPYDVSEGHMNVRSGPGTNHGLLGAIPAGQTVGASRCAPRDDGIAGANWCLVTWNSLTGWVSQAGLMPLQEQPVSPPLPRPTS